MIVFFFEEEEGIRDSSVTGVQTCALPISKGAYNRPSYPCHHRTYRGGLLRQGAVDKAKTDDQRHAGERQHDQLQVRKAVSSKQRKIVHDTLPKDVPVISRSEPAEGSAVGTHRTNGSHP